jgi:dUTP pyrophosphatase
MSDNNQFLDQLMKQYEKVLKEYDIDLNNVSSDDILGESQDKLNDEMLTISKMKELRVKKINDSAVLPKYNYHGDSGFDLYSVEDVKIPSFGRYAVSTGLVIEFDEGLELQVRPKSGLALNQGITVLNTPGTVDHGYTGEIKVIVHNTNAYDVDISKGMKIAQGVLCPVINGKFVKVVEINTTSETERGNNGFGSTGIF